jgi:hypothetical protein
MKHRFEKEFEQVQDVFELQVSIGLVLQLARVPKLMTMIPNSVISTMPSRTI